MSRKKAKATLDLSGVWYNPERPGFGVFINNYGTETHSVAIYSFKQDGGQIWLVGAASRGEALFPLNCPEGTGFLDGLIGYGDKDAGSIEFDVAEPGKISYKAKVKGALLYPAVDFSPAPPEFMAFEGVLTKLG